VTRRARGKSRNGELELLAAITAARVRLASGSALESYEAAKRLGSVIQGAVTAGFARLAFEARLALGAIQLNAADRASARAELESLEKEAASRRFFLLARKAAAALRVGQNQAVLHLQN